MTVALGYLFSILYGAFCIGVGQLTGKLGLPKKYSRKIVHISVGFEWFILRSYMGASWHFLAVCLLFLFLLYISLKKNWFSSMSSDAENAPGTVYYALAMSVMAAVTLLLPDGMMPFGIAVICTSLGDGFAGILGQLQKKNAVLLYGKKTLLGFIGCFAFSFFGIFAFSAYFSLTMTLPVMYFIALFAASVELVSKNGLDNLTVPLSVFAFSYGWLYYSSYMPSILLSVLLTPWIIVLADRNKALTKSGILAALLLDGVMTFTLGNAGFFLLLCFLGFGALCDAVKKKGKHTVAVEEEKSGARDAWQVLANGGVLSLFSLLYACTFEPVFLCAALASIAEALGDTAASGFGALSKKTLDLFHLKPCSCGLSGGMSLVGTLAALGFSGLSLGISRLLFEFSLLPFAVMLTAAFLGTVFDSFLGSVCQRKYRCTVCGCQTEGKTHCGTKADFAGGFPYVNNDVVNVLSSLFSALSVLFLFLLL